MDYPWKKLCEEIEAEVLEKCELEESKRGAYEGTVDEPQWIIKEADCHLVKE